MKKTVLYLAGPMRGIPEFNFPKFFWFERKLINAGYEVINPARHDQESGLQWRWLTGNEDMAEMGFDVEEALDWDLQQIVSRADGVAVIDDCDWESSIGTQFEVAVAREFHKRVAYAFSWRSVDWSRGMGAQMKIDEEFNVSEAALSRAAKWRIAYCDGASTLAIVRETSPISVKKWGVEAPVTPADEYISPPRSGGIIPKEVVTTLGRRLLNQMNAKNINDFSIDENLKEFSIDEGAKVTFSTDYGTMGDSTEVRTTSSTGGQKGMKLARYDLIPVDALRQVAEHYGKGAQKYSDNNWRKGYEWSKSFAALQRHVNEFWGGENIDAETGSNHMAAVAFHALTLLTFVAEHPEFDDRYKK